MSFYTKIKNVYDEYKSDIKIKIRMEANMKQLIILITLTMVFCGFSSNAFSASGRCTVVKIEANKMIIECDKKPNGFKEGDRLKVKTANTPQGVLSVVPP